MYQCEVEECDKCLSCEQVLAMETELEDEMEARDCSDLKEIQSLVNKWTPHLHSQHFLMLLLKGQCTHFQKMEEVFKILR